MEFSFKNFYDDSEKISEFEPSDYYLFYSNFLKSCEPLGQWPEYGTPDGRDKIQQYRINSHGYRSPEFEKNKKIIFAGCSQTFGQGLPENEIWPVRLSKKISKIDFDVDCVNLAAPGGSIQSITNDVLHYIRVYGKPEKIFIAYPDMSRFLLFSSPSALVSQTRRKHIGPINAQLHLYRGGAGVPTLSKRPHDVENIINFEQTIMNSLQWINILENYCQAEKIDLYWTIWSPDNLYIKKLKEKDVAQRYYKNYVYFDILALDDQRNKFALDSSLVSSCHPVENEELYSIFHKATDSPPHNGVHYHIHCADLFFEEHRKRLTNG